MERWLSVDPRWLGAFRVLLGALLTVDVLRRWSDARAFYTNDGFLPNHYSLFRPMGRHVFSLFHAFSTLGEVTVAFGLTLIVYACFLVGWHTRLFHVLAAVCVTSLNARNIFVENGGTVVVNILTVVTAFLPLGRRFSLDAVLESLRSRREASAAELNQREPRDAQPVVSLAVLLVLVEWSAIYFFNTVHKNGAGWKDGTAIYWFLEQDRIVRPLAVWIREWIPLPVVKTLTWGTLVVEGSLALLYLWPFWQKWTRRLILLFVWGLHGTIAAWSRLGPFSYVMSLVPVLLLGAADWRWVERWFGRERRARVVCFDGGSSLCLFACRVLVRLDPFERLGFVDARERRVPAADDAALESGWAVVDPASGRVLTHERALAEALFALPFGFVAGAPLRVPGLAWLFRLALGAAGRRRDAIGSWLGLDRPRPAPAARPESAAREWLGFAREGGVLLLGAAIVTQILIDNRFVASRINLRRPAWMAPLIEVPRLLQGWSMFAPEPPYDDGRVVVDGRTADGRRLDPFTGRAPDLDPYTASGWGHDQLWCDYHNRIRFPGHAPNRDHLRQYLLNQHRWSGRPEERLVAFDVWWVQDRSPRPGGPRRGDPLPPQKLLSHGLVRDSGAAPWLARSSR